MARPKMLTHQLVVRVDESTYERLAEEADAKGMHPTQLARWIVRHWLDEAS